MSAVRPATEADLEAIAWLESVAFADPWPHEMMAYELAHPHGVLLVASREPEERPGGYACFRHAAGEAELLRVAVAPEERRRGLARVLILEGLERLRQAGVEVCFLEVRVDNRSAIALYEAIGFTCAGLRRGYYRDGTDALIFSLAL